MKGDKNSTKILTETIAILAIPSNPLLQIYEDGNSIQGYKISVI